MKLSAANTFVVMKMYVLKKAVNEIFPSDFPNIESVIAKNGGKNIFKNDFLHNI